MRNHIEEFIRKNAVESRNRPLEVRRYGKRPLAFFLFLCVLVSVLFVAICEKEKGKKETVTAFSESERGQERELSGEEGPGKLPALIQTTTLREDYQAKAGLGLAFTPLLPEEDFDLAFENILCSCVCLQADGYYGSGSIFLLAEDEIIIVSNRHLLQYWNEDSFVTFYGGAAESGEVIGVSGSADVGFLSVPIDRFSWQELLEFRNVRPAEEMGNGQGSGILLVNMADDPWHPVKVQGGLISSSFYLEDFGMEMLYGTGEALPGMSGSGIFDGYGNYLGMLTGGNLRGEIAAVPAGVIVEEYWKLGR